MRLYYRLIQAFLYYVTTPINKVLISLGGGQIWKAIPYTRYYQSAQLYGQGRYNNW